MSEINTLLSLCFIFVLIYPFYFFDRDEGVGKTSLLYSFYQDKFFPDIGTYEDQLLMLTIDETPANITLYDTTSSGWQKGSPSRFERTDIFLCCYSVDVASSLASVQAHWIVEVTSICPSAIIFLIGTKMDKKLEAIPTTCAIITEESVLKVFSTMRCSKRFECSSKTQVGIKSILTEAVRSVRNKRVINANHRRCLIQ